MVVEVGEQGARRLQARHPWVFKRDLVGGPDRPGLYPVFHRRRFLALAVYNPDSWISVRAYSWRGGDPRAQLLENLDRALARRREDRLRRPRGARRLAHAEGDFLPGLVVDEYAGHLAVQVNAAGLEPLTEEILSRLAAELDPRGVVLANDSRGRRAEGLPLYREPVLGDPPDEVEVEEGRVRLLVPLSGGQKTGAFLDQRENHLFVGELAGTIRPARALDLFAYHGGFALQVAPHAGEVVAVDSSAQAVARIAKNAALNRLSSVRAVQADAFAYLRSAARRGRAYDLVVLDPPSFARRRRDLDRAKRAYKEINLQAIRLLAPGGWLFTASCSFHLGLEEFLEVLRQAAGDAGRTLELVAVRGQASDHPRLVNVPETGYLKFAALRALE